MLAEGQVDCLPIVQPIVSFDDPARRIPQNRHPTRIKHQARRPVLTLDRQKKGRHENRLTGRAAARRKASRKKLDFAESLAIEGLEVGGRSRLYDHVEQYEKGPRRSLHQDRFHLRPRDL